MFFLGWQGIYTFVALCVFVCLMIAFFAKILDEEKPKPNIFYKCVTQ